MKRSTIESKSQAKQGQGKTKDYYFFRLFVAGNEANSTIARKSLDNICAKHLKNRCRIEVIDIFQDYQSALDEDILITPALIIRNSNGRVAVFGNLKDEDKVLAAIDSLGNNGQTIKQ